MPKYICTKCTDAVPFDAVWNPKCPSGHGLPDVKLYVAPIGTPTPTPTMTIPVPILPPVVSTTTAVPTAVASDLDKFNAVMSAWKPASTAATTSACASTHGMHPWDYTATFQWNVSVDTKTYKVRAHVHYTKAKGVGYHRGPGNCWVSGIDDQSKQTPVAVVNKAPADPNPWTGPSGTW